MTYRKSMGSVLGQSRPRVKM